ncbi:hypothetical protein B2G71_04470 [Novosphingobium sp. PC22D]|uniref:MFS transporter n=1 Tax=Novosphingobium sp. PC22D TaxID=1962403 RepID=UPI000BF04145|nr:MFS transporter [Novosphingobium sp. PC22D]PEQ13591.1 hypothetical protein B2G71_04470 [Novosphingobium sp. PC22D]
MIARGEAGREWRAGWPVVLAATAGTTLPIVHLYSTGVMLPALEAEFGWTRAEISSGPAIVSVVVVLLAPIVGMLVDRFGPRLVGLAGGLWFCLSISLLGLGDQPIATWWALWALVSLGAVAVNPSVWAAGVSRTFNASRGLALAVALTGTGIGALLVPIAAGGLLEAFGWRQAYLLLGLCWGLVAVPLIYAGFRMKDDRSPAKPEGTVRSGGARTILLSRRFAMLALAATAVTFAGNGIVINLVPMLIDRGLAPLEAAGVAGVAGIGSIVGRLSGGLLLDRINAGIVAALSAGTLCLGVVVLFLLPASPGQAIVAVAVLGLAVGVEFDAVAYLASRHFGLEKFGLVFGTITGLLALTGGLAPLATNTIFDVSGSYFGALFLSAPLAVGAAALFLLLGPYPADDGPHAAASQKSRKA